MPAAMQRHSGPFRWRAPQVYPDGNAVHLNFVFVDFCSLASFAELGRLRKYPTGPARSFSTRRPRIEVSRQPPHGGNAISSEVSFRIVSRPRGRGRVQQRAPRRGFSSERASYNGQASREICRREILDARARGNCASRMSRRSICAATSRYAASRLRISTGPASLRARCSGLFRSRSAGAQAVLALLCAARALPGQRGPVPARVEPIGDAGAGWSYRLPVRSVRSRICGVPLAPAECDGGLWMRRAASRRDTAARLRPAEFRPPSAAQLASRAARSISATPCRASPALAIIASMRSISRARGARSLP